MRCMWYGSYMELQVLHGWFTSMVSGCLRLQSTSIAGKAELSLCLWDVDLQPKKIIGHWGPGNGMYLKQVSTGSESKTLRFPEGT